MGKYLPFIKSTTPCTITWQWLVIRQPDRTVCIYHTSTLVKSFEIDLLCTVMLSVQVWGCSNRKVRCPEDIHGERSCSCEELRTKGYLESHTLLMLHIRKMSLTVSRDLVKRLNCGSLGARPSLQLSLWGVSGVISGETKCTTNIVQVATAATFLSSSRTPELPSTLLTLQYRIMKARNVTLGLHCKETFHDCRSSCRPRHMAN